MITEPQWGIDLLNTLNQFVSHSTTTFRVATFFADYPIFLIPLFLVITYIYRGIVKKHTQAKYGALLILAVAVIAVAINLGIQHFIDKVRPETALISAGHLVLKHLPTRSFPSDHAAVSLAVALAALVRGFAKGKKKTVIWRGRVLLVGSIVMSVARIAVGVHWPTDILAGWGVAMIAVCIVFWSPVQFFLEKYIIRYIIDFEMWFLGLFGVYKKGETDDFLP